MITNLPMELPKCPTNKEHGYLHIRPLAWQTKEQKWCGVWYDCDCCGSSVLFESTELQRANLSA